MKELLSLLAVKTQSLVGKRFPRLQSPRTTSDVGREPLAMLAESHNSLEPNTDLPRFVADLAGLKLTERVVVFEGAFSAAISLDVSHPREYARAAELVDLAPEHISGLGLGVGHALSNLQVEANITASFADHFLGFMAMDSYGMHEGYFRWYESVQNMKAPNLPPVAMAGYDQGLGRALWFMTAGEPKALQLLLDRFRPERRANLWRGVGLMASFWGGLDDLQLKQYLKFSKQFRPCLQQGAAQGISMRTDMGEVISETNCAAAVLCEATSAAIAEVAEACLIESTTGPFDSRAYLAWQHALTEFFVDDGT